VTRDAANRLGIALRYAHPPGQGATLGDWREYAERVVSEASVRGLDVSVSLSGPADEAAVST
jgi:hypothetical protein